MGVKIKGERINLRSLEPSDAMCVYENFNNKAVKKYINFIDFKNLSQVINFIKQSQAQIKNKTAYNLGIEFKKTNGVIGMVALKKIHPVNRSAEISYWLGKDYWGEGYAREAVKLVLDFSFNTLDLVRIYTRIMDPNLTSIKLLEKCGFRYEGRLKKSTFKDGKWFDNLRYAILREDL